MKHQDVRNHLNAILDQRGRKSSRSNGTASNCVQTALIVNAVAVRDTKDDGRGPVLLVPVGAWSGFLSNLASDQLT